MESGLKTWIERRRKRERGKERDGGKKGERAKYIAYYFTSSYALKVLDY